MELVHIHIHFNFSEVTRHYSWIIFSLLFFSICLYIAGVKGMSSTTSTVQHLFSKHFQPLKSIIFFIGKMANFHSRSNSFPSQTHPIVNNIEDHLRRLRASEATSTSATSICENLSSLRNLHEGINNTIQMPSIQQALSHEQDQSWINELLEGSMRLVDLCEFSREVVCLTKESVQDLESSIRRNRSETATNDDIKAYVASRKKITKMVNKYIKNLKSFNKNSTALPDIEIGMMLKETEKLAFSVLKSALTLISGEEEKSKQRSWSILSKFTQTNRAHSELDDSCSLDIHEVEEGLESFFRSLIRTRVALLNVISH